MSVIKVVEDFIGKWNDKDFEGMMSFFEEDVFYYNIFMEFLVGVVVICEGLIFFFGMVEEISWKVLYIVEGVDGVVMIEWFDDFKINGKWMCLFVMGIFEI